MKSLRYSLALVAASFALTSFVQAESSPTADSAPAKPAKCCVQAAADSKECTHGCCVTAAKETKNCEKCGGKNTPANNDKSKVN